MTTVSPDSIVRAGLVAALKLPIFTVCGLGISVYSAARACPMHVLQDMTAPATSCAKAGGTVFPGLVMTVSLLMRQTPQAGEGTTAIN